MMDTAPEGHRVMLHIGMHKTGTTSIQIFLDRHGPEIMATSGILYPVSGRDGKDHTPLARSALAHYGPLGQPHNGAWSELRNELRVRQPRVAILSSERFWPASEEEIHQIQVRLQPFHVQVIVYVRNHMDCEVASFKQAVKTGMATDLDAHWRTRLWRLDYDAFLSRWKTVLGAENVSVRIYDKVRRGLIKDFASATGISLPSDSSEQIHRNASPTDGVIRFVSRLNRLEETVFGRDTRGIGWLRRAIVGGRFVSRLAARVLNATIRDPLASDRFQREFRLATEEMRNRFLVGHVDPSDWHHFDCP